MGVSPTIPPNRWATPVCRTGRGLPYVSSAYLGMRHMSIMKKISVGVASFVAMCLVISCGDENGRVARSDIRAEGKAQMRLKMGVSPLGEARDGKLRGVVSIFNDSGFPVMLRIPSIGLNHGVSLDEHTRGALVETKWWGKVGPLGYGGSAIEDKYEYCLLAARSNEAGYTPDGIYSQQIVLATKEEYGLLKRIGSELGIPIKLEVQVEVEYLDSCPAVRNANAKAIRDGSYKWVQLKRTLGVVPNGGRGVRPKD